MSVAAAVPDRTSCRQAGTRTTVLGGLLETTLADRRPEEGRGWQGEHEGIFVHPGERWVICRDSEGTPFGLASSE